MKKLIGEKAEQIVEVAKAANLQPSTQVFDDDDFHMETTVTVDGKMYRVTCAFTDDELEAVKGDLELLDYDSADYTVEAYDDADPDGVPFDEKQVFEITRNDQVVDYETADLVGTAIDRGLDFVEYKTLADAKEAFGEVPVELAALLADGPAVEIAWDDRDSWFVSAEKCNREEEAVKYLAQDLYALVILSNTKDAEDELKTYDGNCKWQLHRAIVNRLEIQLSRAEALNNEKLAAECRRIIAAESVR